MHCCMRANLGAGARPCARDRARFRNSGMEKYLPNASIGPRSQNTKIQRGRSVPTKVIEIEQEIGKIITYLLN